MFVCMSVKVIQIINSDYSHLMLLETSFHRTELSTQIKELVNIQLQVLAVLTSSEMLHS